MIGDPVVEEIAQNIQEVVNAITVANGYQEELTCVRPTRLGFEDDAAPEDGRVVLFQGEPELDERNSAQGNSAMLAWMQPFWLVAFVLDSDDVTGTIDTRINRIRADIEKALMVDPQRNGLALDTRIQPPLKFSEGPGVTGIVVVARVLYRTREDDPYTAA